MTEKLWDYDQLAEYLGLAVQTCRKMVCYRKIPYYKIGGAVRFDREEIEKWLEEKRKQPV